MVNDAAPSVEKFAEVVAAYPALRYVVGEENGAAVCLFLLQADCEHPGGIDVHFVFAPGAWGWSLPIAQAFTSWMWRETDASALIGRIPSYNRLALQLARAAGFVPYARLENVGFKHGKPFAVICTRLERPKEAQKAA